MTSLLVCSHVRLYREGLAEVLGRQPDIDVLGHAGEPAECAALLERLLPEIMVLDTGAPWAAGLAQAVGRLKRSPRVIALALPEDEDAVVAYAESGIAAYVMRDESIDDLVEAVRHAARGEMRCSPVTAGILVRHVATLAAERVNAVAPPTPSAHLTPREMQIVALVEEGLSNKQIAQRLHIELPTVKNHVHRVLAKLAVRRRSEVAAVIGGRRAADARSNGRVGVQ